MISEIVNTFLEWTLGLSIVVGAGFIVYSVLNTAYQWHKASKQNKETE